MTSQWQQHAAEDASARLRLVKPFLNESGYIEITESLLRTMFESAFIDGALVAVMNCEQHGHNTETANV